MIREALAALLSFEDDIEVVAQVGRGDEVTAAARRSWSSLSASSSSSTLNT